VTPWSAPSNWKSQLVFRLLLLRIDIEVPDIILDRSVRSRVMATPVLHFSRSKHCQSINVAWYRSAGTRAAQLMAASPRHKDKYLWFLALHQAAVRIANWSPLGSLASISEGLIKWDSPATRKLEGGILAAPPHDSAMAGRR